MSIIPSPSSVLPATKPHYHILDGLRGVAALMVVIYHIGEAYATSPATQQCNHGYLAVQFFFILSGFVIGYSYDDRIEKMGAGLFLLRRLIRLHPMVIIGALLGLGAFLMQGSVTWEGAHVPFGWTILAFLCTILMIPAAPGSHIDIRGNNEIFPINGPQWSLLMEYIGNIAYAFALRRMSNKALLALVSALGIGCAAFAVGNATGYGQLGPGWTLQGNYFWGALMVMLFCFSTGLLLARVFKPSKIKGAFWICSATLVVLLSMPYIGTESTPWLNGIYDTVCILFIFPALVWIGASGQTTDKHPTSICNFWGDVSYPLYIIHYPSMYLFYAWVWNGNMPFSQAWPVALGIIVGNVALAWMLLKTYDAPVRKWLSRRFLTRNSA